MPKVVVERLEWRSHARLAGLAAVGRRLVALAVASALLPTIVGPVATAHAAESAAVTITIAQVFPGGPPAGWSASGAFTDSGAWVTDSVHGSLPSPTTAAFHRETTEFGSAGAFHMKINFAITVVGLTSGTWVIPMTGTGAYSTMTGQGTCEPTASPTPFVITCTGVVHM